MNSFLKAISLLLALVVFISLLIVLPTFLFGAFPQWQIFVLGPGYFCFFLGTIWRTLKHGELTPYREDEQVKRTSGRLASIIQIIGLLSVHWLAIYDFFHAQNHESYAIEVASTTVGISFIVLSIIINQIAVRTLGKFFDRLTIKPEHQLITTGIYSWVQHPIYLSYILLFMGFCTLLQSSISFVLLAIVCIIWFGNRIMIEEEMLVKEFGEDYKTYQQQTKRIFPFIY
jgi:protein-S-isoprenylcysteine O-methyltransferase Ste14